VGEAAGDVWQTLDENGPQSVAKLVKLTGAPRDVVLLAIGWLAREDKITLEEGSRGRVVALRA
jgi:hypothetical protein